MKRLISVMLVVSMMLLAVGSVAFADEEKQVLTFMMWDEGTGEAMVDCMKKAIADFNATNEYNVVIVPEYIASENTKTKLPTVMAANSAPDLFNAWVAGYLEPYVSAGKVYDLSEALAADPEWANSFLDGTFSYLTYGDGIYGVPMQISVWCMYYNTEIFDSFAMDIPETWDELVDDLKVIHEADSEIIPFAYGNKSAWPIASLCEGLTNRIGGSEPFAQAATGEIEWTDEAFSAAAEKIVELVEAGLLPDGVNALETAETHNQFATGKAAVMSILDSRISMIAGSDVDGMYVVKNIPPVEGGVGDENLWLGQPNRTICISESCPNKEAAVAFLKYLTSPEVVQYNLDNAGIIPVIKSSLVDTSNVPAQNAKLLAELDSMSGMFVFYDVVLGSLLGNEYNQTIQRIVAGTDITKAFEDYQAFCVENR